MKVLYISGLCSRKAYSDVIKEEQRTGQQLQKFGRLLTEGLKNNGVEVSVLSKLPVNRKNCKKIFIKRNDEIEGEVQYHYQLVINLPIIRNIVFFFGTMFYTMMYCIKNRSIIVICDPMLVMPFLATRITTKLCGNILLGLLTDIPTIYAGNVNKKVSFPMKVSSFIMTSADCYVLLTEKMNAIANPNKKPYIVMEGMADEKLLEINNSLINKHKKRVCLYTGGIIEIYGLGMLVQAFCDADLEDCELHIYGGGSYEKKLSEICSENTKIKYFGVRDNEFIVKEQMKATLLINPRLTNLEYTHYSFPSKNMEYMASGTPTLTTNLPGMPKDYLQYVYLFNEETVDGMKKTLKDVLSISDKELFDFGQITKKWIIENKNNTVQMSRVVNFIQTVQNNNKI